MPPQRVDPFLDACRLERDPLGDAAAAELLRSGALRGGGAGGLVNALERSNGPAARALLDFSFSTPSWVDFSRMRAGTQLGLRPPVLSALALRRIQRGEAAPLEALLRDVLSPPLDRIGVMAFEEFLPPKEQQSLAQALNTLFASPRLQAWQGGAPLDVASWLKLAPPSGPGG